MKMRALAAAFTAAFLLIVVSVASAQPIDSAEILGKFGLNDEEIERVMAIQRETERTIQEARVELNLLKAQLEKLLFDIEVDMNRVEKLLRQSIEWKLKSELAEIRRRVELRKLFGEERWANFLRARARWNLQNRQRPQE
jgi:hypothetical protein